MYSLVDVHIPHLLLNLILLHLLDLIRCQFALLRGKLMHVHSLWSLRHSSSHWHLLWHCKVLLQIWLLLKVNIDVDAWINHRLILVCLINYIWVITSKCLLRHQVVMTKALFNLWSSCLKRHWLKNLVIFNQWLIKCLERINIFLLLNAGDIVRKVE